ncbi:MAG: hypothetical protein H7A42_06070 [Chlamydiales bacterium]|nr:hypothetical protein [Chlamydiales bacterium]
MYYIHQQLCCVKLNLFILNYLISKDSCEFVAAAIETLFTQMQAMLSNFVGTIQRYVEDWTATPDRARKQVI